MNSIQSDNSALQKYTDITLYPTNYIIMCSFQMHLKKRVIQFILNNQFIRISFYKYFGHL